ncbi:threonine synthase [Paenibacillus sp. GCM10023248]|uniref:threonine synthase n=1 Tax=Bacillales TaxID=1385 RepID=UPI0023798184|nr:MULTISPECIES: threonine synthase [Bacillales]MDD9267411.1 threonine synthase [Paenibacillus sp. MAHUQ-63]MDR6882626.1 threonine synthase [Bacillus sp. 3255]
MSQRYVSHLYCPKCAARYDTEDKHQLCTCGSPLLVAYDMERIALSFKPSMLRDREPSLWRYRELLPVIDPEHIVTLGEGLTPLLPMPSIGADMNIPGLMMKDEGLLPTGSFKARGAAVGISKAKELGVKELAMPTNGNAGAAWALYAARAKMKSTILMPVDAPLITRNECAVSGANLYLVNGLISDAGRIVADLVKAYELYDASTLKEPYRIEGKKTMGLEIAEQLNWQMPDVILYPTGGGVGLIGIHKALRELQTLGWVQGKLPRLVAVQAEGCAPIVKAWEKQEKASEFWPQSKTAAFGINVPKALGDFLVLEAIYETGGCAVAIPDEELLQEQQRVAELEGAFICPEGAATFAAARKLRNAGWIREHERVIALNTGAGVKYPDTVRVVVPVLEPEERITR